MRNLSREPWVRYPQANGGMESTVRAAARLVWPLILKAAIQGAGRIPLPPPAPDDARPLDERAARHLFQLLGRDSKTDDRFVAAALSDLLQAGLVTLAPDAVVIVDWAAFAPFGRWGKGRRIQETWVRLYRFESPSFAALPMMVRGFAHLLMRQADYDGTVNADPEKLVFLLGWSEERHLRWSGFIGKALAALFADGYLIRHPTDGRFAMIKNFAAMQPDAPAAIDPKPAHAPSPTEVHQSANHQRTVSEPSANHQRSVSEPRVKSAELFTSPPHERTNEWISDQNPPTPPQAGGGQAELFPASERRAAHAKLRKARPPRETRMPAPADPPAGGYPAPFREAYAAYPNKRGHQRQAFAVWQVLAVELGEDVLAAAVKTHLAWKLPSHWADGIGIPYFERYLHKRHWADARPANPEAEKPAARTPAPARDWEAERRQREQEAQQRSLAAQRARAIEAQQAAAAAAATAKTPEQEARATALDRTDFRAHLDCGGLPYHRPSDPGVDAIWDAVMAERIPAFRREHPGKLLPRIMREYLVAKPDRAGSTGNATAPTRLHITPSTRTPPFAASARAPAPRRPQDEAAALRERLQGLAARFARVEQVAPRAAAGGRG